MRLLILCTFYFYLATGLLIFFNTFASQIMFAISLPLLFIWNCNVSSCNSNSQSGEGDQTKNDGTAENGGELALRENPTLTRFGMFRLMAFYLAVRMLKVSMWMIKLSALASWNFVITKHIGILTKNILGTQVLDIEWSNFYAVLPQSSVLYSCKKH